LIRNIPSGNESVKKREEKREPKYQYGSTERKIKNP